MHHIRKNGDTLLAPRQGDVGINEIDPAAKLHVKLESTVGTDNVAVFEKQGANDYAVAIGGRRIDGVNMAGGADPELLLNYYATGDVILAWGGGDVGIGVLSPTENLDVCGTARLRGLPVGPGTNVVASTNGTLLRANSSRRYKTNIRALPSDAAAVLMLRPVGFDWRSTGESDVGLIAEEVAEVLPELVVRDSTGRPEAVHYDKVTVYLLEVVKKQQKRLAVLEEMAAQNRLLQARIEALEQAVGQRCAGAEQNRSVPR